MITFYLLFSLLCNIILAQQYISVPGGYAWSECVHEVPDGSHIVETLEKETYVEFPNGEVKFIPTCQYPRLKTLQDVKKFNNKKNSINHIEISAPAEDSNGWQSWTTFESPDNSTFTQFLGYFNVPTPPTKFPSLEDPILYLFTGLQNFNWIPTPSDPTPTPAGFDIIQPVLQYGNTPDAGGKYWAVASWYVTLDDHPSFIASTLVTVKPGDVIFGNMTKTGNDTWFIGSLVNGKTSNIHVTRPRLFTQPYAYCTLEVYNIKNCNEMPTSTIHFTNLTLATEQSGAVTPTWTTFTGPDNNPCKTLAHVLSDSAIDISF